jgi:rare lipoprotein A
MRYLLTSTMLSLAVSAGASLPAAAGASDHIRERTIQVWSDAPGIRIQERAEAPRRQRLAYATPREAYDGDEARPSRQRRAYEADDGDRRPRYTKRRHTRSAKGRRRHRHVAKRPGVSRQAAVHKAPRTTSPTWSKRSLSTDGQRGSGHQGVASFYWQPQRVASGGWFNPNAMTAAHKTLPFGTRVRVTHMGNGRSVEVKINDRGPYIAGRIIDLSKAAAGVIGMTEQGIARIRMEILGR